jgi:hypothetical protein
MFSLESGLKLVYYLVEESRLRHHPSAERARAFLGCKTILESKIKNESNKSSDIHSSDCRFFMLPRGTILNLPFIGNVAF